MSPPISAWEEEEGIPKCHVNRFQPIAPIRAASTSGWQFATISGLTMPDPSVLATFVPKNAPIRLRAGCHDDGSPRAQHLGRNHGSDGVGAVVSAVGEIEDQRHDDDQNKEEGNVKHTSAPTSSSVSARSDTASTVRSMRS